MEFQKYKIQVVEKVDIKRKRQKGKKQYLKNFVFSNYTTKT